MPRLALLLLAVLLLGAVPGRYSARAVPAGEVPPIGDLRFLAGAWETNPGKTKGSVTEEHWMGPRAGTMFGVNRVTKDDRTVFYEHLRIEERAGDGVYYVSSPMGRTPGTAFRLTKLGSNFAQFENPEHDWPQSIAYGLTDIEGQMTAVVTGTQGGSVRTETWTFLRREP